MNRPIHRGDAAYADRKRQEQLTRDLANAMIAPVWVNVTLLIGIIVFAVLAWLGKLP